MHDAIPRNGFSFREPKPIQPGIARHALTFLFLISTSQLNAQSLEEGLLPGVIVTYTLPDGHRLTDVVETPRFDFGNGFPHPSLRQPPKQVNYRGRWLPDGPGTYQWTLSGDGDYRIQMNNRAVGSGLLAEGQPQATTPFTVGADWQEIEIDFKPNKQTSALKISTSNPSFLPEPLSPLRLAHEDQDQRADQMKEGLAWVDQLRCQACHAVTNGWEVETSPQLFAKRSLPAEPWLRNWLRNHSSILHPLETNSDEDGSQSRTSMPKFALSNQDVEDLLAYLVGRQKKQSEVGDFAVDSKEVVEGDKLFHSTGCIACHSMESMVTFTTDLRFIGSKRSSDELNQWLENPLKVDPLSRMHAVPLTSKERTAITTFLRTRRLPETKVGESGSSPIEGSFERGQSIYQAHGCAACHELDLARPRTTLKTPILTSEVADCLSSSSDSGTRPFYDVPDSIRKSVLIYLNSLSPSDTTDDLKREELPVSLQIKRLGCAQCHSRNFSGGIEKNLLQYDKWFAKAGINPVLVRPPALNGVGDKLTDEAWSLVMGKGLRRRDWLTIRMPRYNLDEKDRLRIQQHYQALDAQVEGVQAPPTEVTIATAAITGPRLVTTDGFGCTSCHGIGKQQPIGSEPQNLGPSLSEVDQWIRRSWFERWVRAPARMTPRMEMPSVQVPVQGVLNENLEQQLSSLWQTINTPGFEPPRANPVRIVRHSNHRTQQNARVLTDVMRIKGATLTKPLVIALPNRNTILFDLETGRLSHWWLGDVARQYTEGKTWFWEPGGPPIMDFKGDHAEWQIERNDQWLSPINRGQFVTEAESWHWVKGGLEVKCVMTFAESETTQNDKSQTVHLIQRFEPRSAGQLNAGFEATGFTRQVRWEGLQERQRVRLAPDITLTGEADSVVADDQILNLKNPLPWQLAHFSEGANWDPENQSFEFLAGEDGALTIQLDYSTRLPVDQLQEITKTDDTEGSTAFLNSEIAPGFKTEQIPVNEDWMPTALSWSPSGKLYVASLKGRIWEVIDTNADRLEDQARVIGDELAAPFGIYATDEYVDVVNKFALLRLLDTDQDNDFDSVRTLASGWGHTVDYHDWAVGLPREPDGSYLIALSCQQDQREKRASKFRGQVLKLIPPTSPESSHQRYDIKTLSGGHRFPIGLAQNRKGLIVVTDNQGNYNPFNELNHVQPGKRFGFINAWEKKEGLEFDLTPPAINIPHPWTRSVNGICFLETPSEVQNSERPSTTAFGPFEGHLIGCEYDTRRLVRMSTEMVDGVLQGGIYPFSKTADDAQQLLLGPITCAVSPRGELYIGGIRDSGWGGANNLGTLLRLRYQADQIPCGIAEINILKQGFRLHFTKPVNRSKAEMVGNYLIESYTRLSTPQYGGTDARRRKESVAEIRVAEDGLSVDLQLIGELRKGFVYEFTLENLTADAAIFFPSAGYYTANRIPVEGATTNLQSP